MWNLEKIKGIESIYSSDIIGYIRANISLIGVINAYYKSVNQNLDYRVSVNNQFHIDRCLFHNHIENKMYRFYVNEDEKYFSCLSCHNSGNVIDFVSNVFNIKYDESVELLGSFLGVYNGNLNERQLEIINTIRIGYEYNSFINESKEKEEFINSRIDRLVNYYLDKGIEPGSEYIANRLSYSSEYVDDYIYRQRNFNDEFNIKYCLAAKRMPIQRTRVKTMSDEIDLDNLDDLPF